MIGDYPHAAETCLDMAIFNSSMSCHYVSMQGTSVLGFDVLYFLIPESSLLSYIDRTCSSTSNGLPYTKHQVQQESYKSSNVALARVQPRQWLISPLPIGPSSLPCDPPKRETPPHRDDSTYTDGYTQATTSRCLSKPGHISETIEKIQLTEVSQAPRTTAQMDSPANASSIRPYCYEVAGRGIGCPGCG